MEVEVGLVEVVGLAVVAGQEVVVAHVEEEVGVVEEEVVFALRKTQWYGVKMSPKQMQMRRRFLSNPCKRATWYAQ